MHKNYSYSKYLNVLFSITKHPTYSQSTHIEKVTVITGVHDTCSCVTRIKILNSKCVFTILWKPQNATTKVGLSSPPKKTYCLFVPAYYISVSICRVALLIVAYALHNTMQLCVCFFFRFLGWHQQCRHAKWNGIANVGKYLWLLLRIVVGVELTRFICWKSFYKMLQEFKKQSRVDRVMIQYLVFGV